MLQIVQAIKQVGWSPHLVGWGNLAVFGVTAAQVPPGNGYPLSYFTECTMQTGPYDLRYAAG